VWGRARSLRAKLTLWYVLTFFALQVALLGTIVVVRRQFILRTKDVELEAAAEQLVENIVNSKIGWTVDELKGELPADVEYLFAVVRDNAGQVLVGWSLPEGKEPPFDPAEEVPSGPVGPKVTNLSPDTAGALTGFSARLPMVTVPFRRGEAEDLFYLQVALRDPGPESVFGPFFDLAVVGVPVGVAAAMLAAWIIAGRALRPLDRLASAARAVSPTRLGERFDPASSDKEFLGLAEELNSALARIEAGYRSQDQFLSNVAHELKTPLAVLLTEAQVARLGPRQEADALAFVRHAEDELKRLSRIVESFLVLARARAAGERQLRAVAVHDLVLQAVQDGRVQAEERGVRLIANLGDAEDGAPEPFVAGDADLLQTMIDNLVRNAVAHSPAGSAVAIDSGREGRTHWIAVRDRGPGIPAIDRDRVFERFVQVKRDLARPRGTGLGLAIARDVARVHGGTIRIEDRDGGGSSVIVTLPAAAERAVSAPLPSGSRRSRAP
jgi:signal transduction histidine kinase